MLPSRIDPEVFWGLVTATGGEVIPEQVERE